MVDNATIKDELVQLERLLREQREDWNKFRENVHALMEINEFIMAAQTAKIDMLRACLTWLVHLANGVGKSGDAPEQGEWEAAWKEAENLLRSDRDD